MSQQFLQKSKKAAAIALCTLLLVGFAAHEVFSPNGYMARRRRRAEIQGLTADIERLKKENLDLSGRIHDLRSKPEAIEKIAREQLKLGRPNDVIVTLPQPSQAIPTPSAK